MNGPNTYRYLVVDVFTRHHLEGNPLAVFPSAVNMDEGSKSNDRVRSTEQARLVLWFRQWGKGELD